jgi:hypothetical protein
VNLKEVALAALMLALAGCARSPGKDTALIGGTSYDDSALGSYFACVVDVDPIGHFAAPICDGTRMRPVIVPAGAHRLLLGLSTRSVNGHFDTVTGPIFTELAAGQSYRVVGQVLSSDRVRFWLADAAGQKYSGILEAFLPGRGPAQFVDDSGQPPAPEKHSLYMTVSLGPRSGPVETDFIRRFADLTFSCQADASILSLPREEGGLSLEPHLMTPAQIVARAHATKAESMLEVKLTQWWAKDATLDSSALLPFADYRIELTMANLATGASEWSAAMKLAVRNGVGGEALAEALIRRFAEIGVFRHCPASVIN